MKVRKLCRSGFQLLLQIQGKLFHGSIIFFLAGHAHKKGILTEQKTHEVFQFLHKLTFTLLKMCLQILDELIITDTA